jgi:hypothetical protein
MGIEVALAKAEIVPLYAFEGGSIGVPELSLIGHPGSIIYLRVDGEQSGLVYKFILKDDIDLFHGGKVNPTFRVLVKHMVANLTC